MGSAEPGDCHLVCVNRRVLSIGIALIRCGIFSSAL